MKISIITPSYNQGEFIEKNILSILNQNYTDFEHIIIDGGSNDNTLDILKKYTHLTWISEKDEGQADALNKGLKLANGEIIGWLNSDDYYLNNTFISISNIFDTNNNEWLIGNIQSYFTKNDKFTKLYSPTVTFNNLLLNPDIVRQQATFFRKSFLKKIGGWQKKYYMIMDYDLWIRASKVSTPKMVNDFYAVFVHHPNQKTDPKNHIIQTKEIVQVLIREKATFSNIIRIVLKKSIILLRYQVKKFVMRLFSMLKN
jgi:glycosyltransferase involved in cell wall biosynthesis